MATFGQHQNASLYVGDLVPDVTESTLFDVFKAVGPVLSIRVCRDAVTRRSLGYAYVNFQNPNDAERALETLNYQPVRGNPIRIMWSQRDPHTRKSGAGNVFIRNLHPSIDNQTLYDTFSQFGNILSCKVAIDPASGQSRGFGFVHFESEDSAKAAIEKVNNMLLNDCQVYVGPFIRRTQRLAEEISRYTNVYIKDFKNTTTVEELLAYFRQFGEPKKDAYTVRQDKKGRAFAFIDFAEHEAACKAVSQVHGTHTDLNEPEQVIYVQRAQKRAERLEELRKRFAQMKARRANDVAGSNIYIKNLDDTVGDKELREAFQRFGEIVSAKVMLDEKDPPQSKGFAFVCYKDPESANKAIAEMNNFMLGAKPLYVNVAQRKEVRRAHLEIQYAARMGGRLPMAPNPAVMRQMYPNVPAYPFPPQGFMPFPGRLPIGAKWGQGPAPYPGAIPQMPRGVGGRFPGAPRPFLKRGAGRAGPPPGFQGQAYPAPAAARPAPVAAAAVPVAQPPIGYPAVTADQQLTAAALAQMTPEQQKNALGERLFARISPQHPEHAAKITGMLLEMDVTEQLNMLESPDLLQSKVQEALDVLRTHGSQ